MEELMLSLFLVSTLAIFHTSESVICYTCPVAQKMCNITKTCAPNEICISKTLVLSTGVTLVNGGCESHKVCNDTQGPGTANIGTRSQLTKSCCQTDFCNGASKNAMTTTTTTTTATTPTRTSTSQQTNAESLESLKESLQSLIQISNSVFGKRSISEELAVNGNEG